MLFRGFLLLYSLSPWRGVGPGQPQVRRSCHISRRPHPSPSSGGGPRGPRGRWEVGGESSACLAGGGVVAAPAGCRETVCVCLTVDA